MTTDLAFRIMITTRGIYKTLGVSRGAVYKWRYDLKAGNRITLDLKISLLKKAGFKVVQEMRWTLYLNEETEKNESDYLYDFPGLTLIGRQAGMHDETIRRANKAIIEDPGKFRKIYKRMVY